MRLALTHDPVVPSPLLDRVAAALERLGHRVERVEVLAPLSRVVARLEAFAPELAFNLSRDRLLPALLAQMAIPFTGSDATAAGLAADLHRSRLLLRHHGLRVPGWQLVTRAADVDPTRLRFPVAVGPNLLAAAYGSAPEAVVEDPADLAAAVERALAAHPAGVVIEEYVLGRDLALPFLEGAAKARGGVLLPVERERVARVAKVEPALAEPLLRAARAAVAAAGLRDLGEVAFRVTEEGEAYVLGVDPRPELDVVVAGGKREGLGLEGVVAAIVESAAKRQGLAGALERKPARKGSGLRVGFAFNVKRVKPGADGSNDAEAEYDSPKTLGSIREAIASWGHEVIDLEADAGLPLRLASAKVDVVFNIAEGLHGRNRESQVPALCELLGIPYTGSDPATLSLALDKGLAKRIVAAEGVLTPGYQLMTTGKEKLQGLRFPLIVKPLAEGSSKGVMPKSVVQNERELRAAAAEMAARYRQPALVEEYVQGREFTVGLLGEEQPRVLPPMEIVFTPKNGPLPVYSFEHKLDWNDLVRYDAPARLEPAVSRRMMELASQVFVGLGCRDVARIDFRMDSEGRIHFIECNPLPGLTPGWSDLCIIAQSVGMDYRTLIREILSGAVRRFREGSAVAGGKPRRQAAGKRSPAQAAR